MDIYRNEENEMKPSILIWGVGDRTKKYLNHQFFSECNIVGYVDTRKAGMSFSGKKVYCPSELPTLIKETDYLIICNSFFSEIYNTCLSMGIQREKLIFTDWIEEPFIPYNLEVIRSIEPKLERELMLNRYKLIEMNERDLQDTTMQIGQGKYSGPVYMSDYFRYRSFEFMSDIIEEDNVAGAIAELGVFRGDFSALINQKFPKRKLYLFDTFEGFDKAETDRELKLGRCNDMFVQYHTETSVDCMLKNLPFPEQSIVCKGLFPQSITKEAAAEKYAFVSIDVDFEESIYEGLVFFYPRLSDGGVIFLHDYNSAFLDGVKAAVVRYEKDAGMKLKKVPFADRAGTLVVIK